MTKEIYLDNAATTQPYREAAQKMFESSVDHYYNPSSFYIPSIEVEKEISAARKKVSSTLNMAPEEIFFTSGATESNNTIIKGAVERSRGDINIITTAIEHPSVMNVFNYYKDNGVDVRIIPVDSFGNLDLKWLEDNIDSNTALISIMGANNEIGTINDLVKIREIIDNKNPNAIFHTDLTQAYLKSNSERLDLKKARPDAISLSGHKVHGPKGIGVMAIKKGTKIAPLIHGGGQERNFRSGTENVPAILGLGVAVDHLSKESVKINEELKELRDHFISEIKDIPDIIINSPEDGLPGLISLSIPGIKAEVLLHMLEAKNIFISSGSACSTHEKDSYVHKALDYDKSRSEGTIRISMSEFTNKDDLDTVIKEIKTGTEQLRKLTRFKR